MLKISINDIAAVFSDAMDFKASLTTTTAAMSLNSTTTAATTTATWTTAATNMVATTTAITTYACSSDISTIPCNPSLVSLSSGTLSQLSRDFFSYRPCRVLQEAVEITAEERNPCIKPNFMLTM